MALPSARVCLVTSKVPTLSEDAYRKLTNANLIRVDPERCATAREYHLVIVRIL